MASRIQIARGNLAAIGKDNLVDGELFWQSCNVSNDKELGYLRDITSPYDEGTLYIGRPSNASDIHENPIPIAGARAYKALVFRGKLKTEQNIQDDRFKFVRPGDFYLWDETSLVGTHFRDTDGFLKGDMLLITEVEVSEDTGIATQVYYTKINTGGGDAKLIGFDERNTNFETNTVQGAIEELEYEKLKFGGVLNTQEDVNSLQPHIGTLWLSMTDGLKFQGITDYVRKGDFMVWTNNKQGWTRIPSGFTDAELIDFDPSSAVSAQEEIGTFEANHIEKTSEFKDVKQVLDFLLSNKAQLDASGKVPLSQLHDTVLGNLQYIGTWNPINDLRGVTDPNYQNDWPTGIDTDNSNENASENGNHAGDYYIIETNGVNIQYYDKTSSYTKDDNSIGFAREVIELNKGDWIVYQLDKGSTKGRWEKIDNSDRISLINFHITGTYENGEAARREAAYVQAQVGTPSIAASDKLVIYDNNGIMTVAGIRLVDQAIGERGENTYLPVYVGDTNSLKSSTIQNLYQNGAYITKTNSNLYVGDDTKSHNEYLYGDLYMRPHLELVDSTTVRINPRIYFDVTTGTDADADLKRAALQAAKDQIAGAEFTLPNETSNIVGKLAGVTLITNRLVKSTKDGYIDSTSLEEHMKESNSSVYSDNGEQKYSDYDVINIEFHAPSASVNNLRTRHITIGRNLNPDAPNGGEWASDGEFISGEILVDLFVNPYATTSNIQYMPKSSGTLINTTSLAPILEHLDGKKDRIAIFGDKKQTEDGLTYTEILNSKARQVESLLYDILFKSNSSKLPSDEEYIEKTFNEESREVNYNIESDVVIGESDDSVSGVITKPRSLLVTKSLLLGNNDTNVVHFVPGRELFSDDTQYLNAYTDEFLPSEDVYVELPTKSGVLLTSNSRIDGGYWKASVKASIEQSH